tara:strand:+ start:135 stop:818 length:684 start_codon:yes stop_codon:yes gene_type:complete
MKKIILIFLISALIFISLLIIFDHKIISFYISKKLSKAVGQNVEAESVTTNYKEGSIIINNFKVLNKDNFNSINIFEADKISIKINIKSIFSDLIIIDSLKILNPELFIEIKENKEKKTIKDNLNIVEKINKDKDQKIYPKKRKDKNFFITKTKFINFKVYIKPPNSLKKYDTELSDMTLTNVGNTNQKSKYKSLHYKDAFKLIFQDVYLRITDQELRAFIKKHYQL